MRGKADLLHVWLDILGRDTWVRTTEIGLIPVCLSRRREALLIIEATAPRVHRGTGRQHPAERTTEWEDAWLFLPGEFAWICTLEIMIFETCQQRKVHKVCFLFYRQRNQCGSGFTGKAKEVVPHTKWADFVQKCTYSIWKCSAPVKWYYKENYILLINSKGFS